MKNIVLFLILLLNMLFLSGCTESLSDSKSPDYNDISSTYQRFIKSNPVPLTNTTASYITLPYSFEGATIKWTSETPNIITITNYVAKIVYRPPYQEVRLKADISNGYHTKSTYFIVTVSMPPLPVPGSVQLMCSSTSTSSGFTPWNKINDMVKDSGANIWKKDVVISINPTFFSGSFFDKMSSTYGDDAPNVELLRNMTAFKFTTENQWDIMQYGTGWWKNGYMDFSSIDGDGTILNGQYVLVGSKINGTWTPLDIGIDEIIGPIIPGIPEQGGADIALINLKEGQTYRFELNLEKRIWSVKLVKEIIE